MGSRKVGGGQALEGSKQDKELFYPKTMAVTSETERQDMNGVLCNVGKNLPLENAKWGRLLFRQEENEILAS